MSDGTHALLAPSSAFRWMKCPGAPLYEAKFPDTDSEASAEGTALHEVTESCILTQADAEKFRNTEVGGFTMTDERIESVQKELDYFRSIFRPEIHDLYVERKLAAPFIPQSGGTVDVIMSECLGELHVLDHKFGRRRVNAEGNSQLRIYAACTLDFLPEGQTEVTMHIGQPRLDNFDTDTMKVNELWDWVNDELKPAAEAAVVPGAELIAGDHCQWCKAANVCPRLREYAFTSAAEDFMDELPTELDDEQLGMLLDRFVITEQWIKSVREEAFARAKAGRFPEGWKLVHGRGTRSWRDEKHTIKALLEKWGNKIYAPGKLLSVAQMEKMVGKAHAGELTELWDKSISYTLAKADDKREAVSTAADDFNDFDEVENG